MKSTQLLSIYEFEELFDHGDFELESYDYGRHEVVLSNGVKIRLPLQLRVADQRIEFLEDKPFLIVIIKSGEAVLGLVDEGELVLHKVFRGYLVRKKQGKSQLKHLKTKGKSRAGSRVRLSSTFDFLEQICQKIEEVYFDLEPERIVFHCSELLRPHFFERNKCFGNNDPRLFSLGFNVEKPSYDFLEQVFNRFTAAEVK